MSCLDVYHALDCSEHAAIAGTGRAQRISLRQRGLGEALVFSHCNANHLPDADNPFYDPDTY